ncbi:MAG: hypothetical protein ACK2UR_17355 [Candidatus Promineifilaceae bacterium]|jgi:hypothetical protein
MRQMAYALLEHDICHMKGMTAIILPALAALAGQLQPPHYRQF